MTDLLKLKAECMADIDVISSLCQDALIKVRDLAYLQTERKLVLVMNRFCWEKEKAGGFLGMFKQHQRTRSGLHIDGVLSTRIKNIALGDKDRVLSLLAIKKEELDDGGALFTIEFSAGSSIQIEVECVDAYLEDLSQPWEAKSTPKHDLNS
jgi:hypothetical protein